MAKGIVNQFLDVVEGQFARIQFSADEEGWRGFDFVFGARLLQSGNDLVLQLLVGEAGVIGLFVDPLVHANLLEGDDRLGLYGPIILAAEQLVDQAEIAQRRTALREYGCQKTRGGQRLSP